MFRLIFNIAMIALIHIVLFAAFPETGKNGNLFLGISLFIWCGLVVIISSVLRKISIGFISLIVMLVMYGCCIAATAYLMPQTDKVTAYDKILKGRLPSVYAFCDGMKSRFGLDIENLLNMAGATIENKKNQFEEEHGKDIKNAAEEIKEESKEIAGEAVKDAGEAMQQVGETISE